MAPSKDHQQIERLTQLLEQQAQAIQAQQELMQQQQARHEAMVTKLLENNRAQQTQLPQVVNQSAQQAAIASALDNRISKFVYDAESGSTFNAWYQRYGNFFEEDGKDLDTATKVRLLVSKLGDEDYANFADSIQPQRPDDLTFDAAVQQLKDLFDDTRSVFVRQYECFKMKQKASQDVISMFNQVNAACENADFDACCKEKQKCLILVTALRDDQHDLRQKCLQLMEDARRKKEDITLKKLREECRTYLSVRANATLLAQSSKMKSVDAISSHPQHWKPKKFKKNFNHQDSTDGKKSCLSCGRSDHKREDCKLREATCHICKKKGHIQAICRRKAVQKEEESKKANTLVHTVVISSNYTKIEEDFNEWRVVMKINQQECQMKLDTGAQITLLTSKTWNRINRPKLMPPDIEVKNCNGATFKVDGRIQCDVQYKDQTVGNLEAYVSEGHSRLTGSTLDSCIRSNLNTPD